MRYHVKGGTWKNAEDEVLKAAVMKYGLNQWSRVSSLLVRKSAKQCKERWYEWLDPKIKKTEWSKDEEEKLLHLAKMFPCQWKTISPFVGRTAYQCLEHYEYLLDKAQNRESNEFDPRKLRQNEIDPNPESKPARPDPIDLDEETKETLNEARARVANTRGKKAKRKIREKQLEDARRLAALQKDRELKSVGIEVVVKLPRKRQKETNYNTDVPFMRAVPAGSFSDRLEDTPDVNHFKAGISLQFLETKNRDLDEENKRKKDENKIKNLIDKNLPLVLNKINKLNDPINLIKRDKLNLSQPFVNEDNLKAVSQFAKINNNNDNDNNNFTDLLLEEYNGENKNNFNNNLLSVNSSFKTPLTNEKIMNEAKIAVSLKECDTPLIGGIDSRNDLDNYLKNRNNNNNNNLIDDFNNSNNNINFKTPLPVGDNFLQNKTPRNFFDNNSSNIVEEGISDNSYININRNNTSNLKLLFSNLPKPKNTFEVDDFNEDELNKLKNENENNVELINNKNLQFDKDAEDLDKEAAVLKEKEHEKEMLLISEVIKNNLPRINLNNNKINNYLTNINDIVDNNMNNTINELIKENVIKLIIKDNKKYPFKNMNSIENYNAEENEDNENNLTVERKEYIKQLIDDEVKNLQEENKNISIINTYNNLMENNVSYNCKKNQFVYNENFSKNDKFSYYEKLLNIKNKQLQKELNLKDSLSKKFNILNCKLIEKKDSLLKEYFSLTKEIFQLNKNKNIYQQMLDNEEKYYLKRKNNKEEELNQLNDYYEKLQKKYNQLNNK